MCICISSACMGTVFSSVYSVVCVICIHVPCECCSLCAIEIVQISEQYALKAAVTMGLV